MSGIINALVGSGGGSAQLFVEDVFSTWLYTGTGADQTITNGIDLSGQGGLVWAKGRSNADAHILTDTVRGAGKLLQSQSTAAQITNNTALSGFTTSGFSIGTETNINRNGSTYASWTFREAPKFFDVVTYTGNGSNQNIAHNLGVAPGLVLIKRLNTTGNWSVYHRSIGNNYLILNTEAAQAGTGNAPRAVTDTTFEIYGNFSDEGANGSTYVAYLYAHDTASDGIIQCGSYTGAYPASPTVTLGWEPQWVMIKSVTSSTVYTNWGIWDNMRGMPVGGNDPLLDANRSTQEGTTYTDTGDYLSPTATGFIVDPAANGWNINNTGSVTYVYIAIRRGPMRTPTLGTSVFVPWTRTGTGTTAVVSSTTFPPDLLITKQRTASEGGTWFDRLRGRAFSLLSSGLGAELTTTTTTNDLISFNMNGITVGANAEAAVNTNGAAIVDWNLRRAPGFMDVVCYTGTGTSSLTNTHNLGVTPELIIVKCRSNAGNWFVYYGPITGLNSALSLSETSGPQGVTGIFGNTAPTATTFSVGTASFLNVSARTYVAYLFASAPGVSKVGSYTGNGSSQTINCAFAAGARFVMIKRTDSTGDWYVWDSARGIVAGNDPYLALNSTAAEVTTNDSVDTDNTGFIVNQVAASNVNVNAATYIFLAIA